MNDEPESDLARINRTLKVQTTLIGLLFGLLVRSGAMSRAEVAQELEKVIATSDPEEAALLTLLQARLVARN